MALSFCCVVCSVLTRRLPWQQRGMPWIVKKLTYQEQAACMCVFMVAASHMLVAGAHCELSLQPFGPPWIMSVENILLLICVHPTWRLHSLSWAAMLDMNSHSVLGVYHSM